MKTIMIPIKPKWAELEMNVKKTIEVRKFYIEPPFKVVNYVTQENRKTYFNLVNHYGQIMFAPKSWDNALNGKVAFEYVVNKVDTIINNYSNFYVKGEDVAYTNRIANQSCLQFPDLRDYSKGKSLYAWHISDLIIYEQPKELGEFRTPKKCSECSVSDCYYCDSKPIKRPPQNFVYVEEIRCCQKEKL